MIIPSALIADDEEALRHLLRRRLAQLWPELRVAGEARNGLEALAIAADEKPDIVFLDIRMPGMDGIEVARRLGRGCHVVFVTAYDEYAVTAFESAAVDYLLKPVTDERLAVTLARLKERLEGARPAADLESLLGQLMQTAQRLPRRLQWIRAAQGEVVRLIAVEEVRCFVASDKYTTVVTPQGEFLIRKPIKELEAELDPDRFWRIHRNAIVGVTWIESVRRDLSGRLLLTLSAVKGEIPVSRAFAHLFKQM